jgi:uncharacterized protein YjiS (DUF1127 family)
LHDASDDRLHRSEETEMTMILANDTRVSLIPAAFATVTAAFSAWQMRQARRAALAELADLPAQRLSDLGLTIHDVRDAQGTDGAIGRLLSARRAARAFIATAK